MSGLLDYQEDSVKLLFDTARVMIPVLTGFLALYVGGLGTIWKNSGQVTSQPTLLFAAIPLLLGVVALGFWSGTLLFCTQATASVDFQKFHFGQICARVGHILFFLAVASAVIFFWFELKLKTPHQEAT
jgi:hypothetical protein